jgi:uncharacterized protein
MTSISIPFRIGADGSVARIDTLKEQAETQILDVLMTHANERVMLPRYGAGLRRLLFDTNDPTNLGYAAARAKEALAVVTEARIQTVRFTPSDTDSSTADILVEYSLIPFEQTFTLVASLRGIVTEESFL